MPATLNGLSIAFIVTSTIFGLIALVLACVGIGTPNWQVNQATIDRQTSIANTANFFYACNLLNSGGPTGCTSRSANRNIQQYYPIDARWNQTEWNNHLDNAAGLSIVGIIMLFFGTVATILMLIRARFALIYLFGPILLFLACLFMLAGMAEGAYVLYYNGYSANLYQTAHLLTIFSFLISCIAAGRLSLISPEQEMEFAVLKR